MTDKTIKDLLKRIEDLEKANKELTERVDDLEDIVGDVPTDVDVVVP